MTPVGATLMLVLIAVILAGSRRTALLGFAAGILYLHQGLSFDILGVNLYAHRFLELAGMGRIIVRNELTISKLNKIDKTFLSLFFYTTIVYILRSSDGVTAHVGDFVDATFTYLTFRGLIDNIDDFKWFLNRFAILLVPYVLLAAVEMIMRQNPFAIVGANPWILQFRQGIPRCTASFRHAITFGSLGASFFPIYVGHFFAAKNKIPGLIGVGCCMGVVALSNSGGPLSALIIGGAGWALWHFRDNMKIVRFGMGICLIFIALFMKAPIWALPMKLSNIVGGTGWHRYWLLEMTIRDFEKWWIAGMPMEETAHWFPYMLETTGGADITNEFIAFGLTGGIIAIILFVLLLIKAFGVVGQAMASAKFKSGDSTNRYFIWGVGVMIVVHIATWFGVSYYDQIKLVWYMHLALIAMLADIIKTTRRLNDAIDPKEDHSIQT